MTTFDIAQHIPSWLLEEGVATRKAQPYRVEWIISKPYEAIRSILFDVSRYAEWWGDFDIALAPGTDDITFKPFPFVAVTQRPVYRGDNYLTFQYTKGPLVGYGTWAITANGEGDTIVSYTTSVEGRNWVANTLLNTSIFKLKHSQDIYRLIKGLEAAV